MATRMQQRRGTAAQWTAADPILAAGEIGYETDTNQFKIGDGVNAWSDLSYFKNLEDLGGTLDDYVPLTQKGANNGVAPLDGGGKIPLGYLTNLIASAPEALDTLKELADAVTFVSTQVAAHNSDTTDVHGIVDTGLLATTASVNTLIGTHSTDTTDVHGIANTAILETTTGAQAKADAVATAAALDATTKANAAFDAAALDATTKANAAALAEVNTHRVDTTEVHGIADTALLATKAYADAVGTTEVTSRGTAISTHNSATENVHGISDTSALATKTYADTAVTTHKDATTSVHGIADTSLLATKSYVDTADNLKAALASPGFTGTPTAPTATAGTNTTQVATTAFVGTAVSALVASAPAALDTLNELAAALGSDANFSTTITTALALKASTAQLDAASLSSFNCVYASYTPILTDEGNVIEMDVGTANSITIPPNSSVAFRIGASIDVLQKGPGQTSVVAGAGVTVLNTPGLKFRDRYSMATLIKRDTNTWIVSGDLTA